MIRPKLPNYDLAAWAARPWPERVRMVCASWAEDGYGTPLVVHALYAVKIAFYVAMWWVWCSFTPGHALRDLGAWWASPVAFQKFVLWTMLFEGLGLGCGSGPLTARYVPPIGGALYFLRPGTIKLPLCPGVAVFGGATRTLLDVGLYAATVGLLLVALTAPAVTAWHLAPLIVLVPLMGLTDKTLFLVFRSEHYLSLVICLLAGADWIAGSKWVWMAIWWWAATSKLNRHFPAVMCVMTSNAPWTRFTPLRRMVYEDSPRDLRPSRVARAMAHFGTAVEFLVPAVLMASGGGAPTALALFVMIGFHLFILSNVPMGVPLEWNVAMIYGALVLFGVHADVGILTLQSPVLWAWLLVFHVGVPVYGSLFPRHVSFLLSMRYYAGNWPYSIWLFRGDAATKLEHLPKWSPGVRRQLGLLYDEATITALLSKVVAFRSMHLQGRALRTLVPRAVDDIDRYTWFDGEVIAGMVVGWNFGDGHLSQEQLLAAVQDRCAFEDGELRCIFVESEPWFDPRVQWRIVDAATGLREEGHLTIDTLAAGQPWAEIPAS